MRDNLDLARGWMRKAESDLATCRLALDSNGPYDTACFHAQQAVEKYLKGFLASVGQPAPRSHNLEELQRLCIVIAPELLIPEVDLTELTSYAVQLRCDFDFWPDRDTAEQALKVAERVRSAVLALVPERARF